MKKTVCLLTFVFLSSLFLFFSCADASGGDDDNQPPKIENTTGNEPEVLPDLIGTAEWTSYFIALNREGTEMCHSVLPWSDIPDRYIIIKNGIIYDYQAYSWTHNNPSSVQYREIQHPYEIKYIETLIQVDSQKNTWIPKKKPRYYYDDGDTKDFFDVEQEGNSLVVNYAHLYYWLNNTENTNPTTGNTTPTGGTLKEFSVQVLLDDDVFDENAVLENAEAKTLSFMLSKSEEDESESLPAVNAQWQILSGSDYVSLSAGEGKSVQITNTNYSGSAQIVNIYLSVIPEDDAYKNSSATIKLNVPSLSKKNIEATILYDEKTVNGSESLKSASDSVLSYSFVSEDGNEIEVSAKWEITNGSEYIIGKLTDGNFKISNVNCSGENKSVTVSISFTPKSAVYNPASVSITFNAEDSTQDLQPGSFTSSVALAYRPNTTVYDGRIKISWTKSANAKNYYVYRNGEQIACVSNELEYLDGDYPADISEDNSILTYYVEAVNLGLSSKTANASVDVSSFIPTAPTNCSILPMQDSDKYYGVKVDWNYNDYPPSGFYVYRLLSSSSYATATDVITEGKIVLDAGPDDYYNYNSNTNTYKYSLWDYDIVNEITRSASYAHYVVVAYNCWYPTDFPKVRAVKIQSSTSNVNSQYCVNLVGRECKWSASEQYPSTSTTVSGSLLLSASKCISNNWYIYCRLNFQKISETTYRIYRCARRSNNFGTIKPRDCVYIGSTQFDIYIDEGVGMQYMYRNTASVGTYNWYMYYYVEAVDSKGKVYASSVVKAQ